MKNSVCVVMGLISLSSMAMAQDEAEVFDWKLKPPVGLSGRYTTFMHMKIAQNLPAMPTTKNRPKTFAQRMDIETKQTSIIDYETISRDLTGGTVSRLTYRTITQESTVKINGKAMPIPDTPQMKSLKNLYDGVQIDIKQGPDGRVWNVQGLDKMRQRLSRLFPKNDAASQAMMKSFFDSIFSEKTLRQSWDIAGKYPEKSVRVGESWKYQIPFEMAAMKLNLHGTRQLVALDGNLATVSERSNLDLVSDGLLPKLPNMPEMPKIEMSGGGIMSGKTIVNRETGMEIEAFGTMRMASKIKTVGKGRTDTMETPQWFLMQTHRVFKANPEIESIE